MFEEAMRDFLLFLAIRPVGGEKSGSFEEDLILEARYAMDKLDRGWRQKHLLKAR